jgi:HD superfamily phosphohydrolase
MLINDRLYGDIKIEDHVILDIINSTSFQRLKGVDSAGYFEPHFPDSKISRYEHSIGVYYLLNKFGALKEEQIAGLIHDLSHTVFSHCIDYALGSESSQKTHDMQDASHFNYVYSTDVPTILSKHGFDAKYILDDANFPLKENNVPDLCADRIDYSLRGMLVFMSAKKEADEFLQNIFVQDKKWIFSNFDSAKEFAHMFSKLSDVYYAGLPSAIMFRTVGDYIKHAFDVGYISKNDLYLTDDMVLDKINKYLNADRLLKKYFDRMNLKIKCMNDVAEYEAKVYCKSRAVDPFCRHNGGIKRVSDIDHSWKNIIGQSLKPKEYFLRFST